MKFRNALAHPKASPPTCLTASRRRLCCIRRPSRHSEIPARQAPPRSVATPRTRLTASRRRLRCIRRPSRHSEIPERQAPPRSVATPRTRLTASRRRLRCIRRPSRHSRLRLAVKREMANRIGASVVRGPATFIDSAKRLHERPGLR